MYGNTILKKKIFLQVEIQITTTNMSFTSKGIPKEIKIKSGEFAMCLAK